MKKFIASGIAAALCFAALSSPAFAADILTDRSICFDAGEGSMPSVKSWNIDGKAIVPDVNTIMPVYSASIYDYAKTGSFEIDTSKAQWYIADAVDGYGNYSGMLELTLKNGYFEGGYFLPSDKNKVDPIAFEANAKRVSALMKKRGLNTDCKEVKLIFMEHVGYVYYIDNGSEKMLVAANVSEVNGNFFNDRNGGIVVIGDELKAAADMELEAYNKYLEEFQKEIERLGLGPDDPLPGIGGYASPMFKVDNTPYIDGAEAQSAPNGGNEDNPVTGAEQSETERRMTVLKIELSALAASAVGIAVISRKRKRGDRE